MTESGLTEEISGLLWFTDQWRPNSKLVLGQDSEFILVVLSETSDYIGTLLRVIRDMDPGFSVFLTLFNHIVGDLGATIICGRVPG